MLKGEKHIELPEVGPATEAMLDLLQRPNEDEDNDYIALTDESWSVVHTFLLAHNRNPLGGLVNEPPPPQFGVWTPVTEAMPEFGDEAWDDERVLVTDGINSYEARWTFNRYATTPRGRRPRWERFHRVFDRKVVAWMPMPEPPGKDQP